MKGKILITVLIGFLLASPSWAWKSSSTGDATQIQSTDVDAPEAGDDGKYLYYDHSNSKFDYGDPAGTPATADISDVSVTQTELAELEAIGATTISAAQWAGLGAAGTFGISVMSAGDEAAFQLLITSPWADADVADDITASSYMPLAGGTFSGFPTTPEEAPDADYEVANKKYADDIAALVDTDDEIIAIINDSPSTQIGVPAGGIGVGTLNDGGLLVGAGTGAVEVLADGLATQILVGGGANTNPAWGTDIPTAVTIGSAYIYRANGTDVPDGDVADTLTVDGSSSVDPDAIDVATGSGATDDDKIDQDNIEGFGASADPQWVFVDTTDGAGEANIYANSSGDNDVILNLGVEDSSGENTDYIEVDGASETVDILKPLVADQGLTITSGAADVALAAAGAMHLNTTDEQLSFHSSDDGEISGEVALSLLDHVSVVLDPGAWYDSDTEAFIMTVGDDYPEGLTIVEWKVSCNLSNPSPEINADLRYADSFIGFANAADIDEIDTSSGVSSEDTNANINSGNAVANGKVIYIGFDADPEGTCTQMIFEMWFYGEED
jgi:hypothetical protein